MSTPHLVPELLRALQKQLDEDGVELQSFSACHPHNEPELIDSERCEGKNEINHDDVKGDELNFVDVRAGQLEMDWVMRQKVFVRVPLERSLEEQGRLHEIKWVNSKKGDKVR